MKTCIIAALLCFITIHVLSQHPPRREPNKQIPRRTDIGKDKPRLFTSSNAATYKQPNGILQPKNILSVLNTSFQKARVGDTLSIPFNTRPLQAVVMANAQKSPTIFVMNLKVINYQNASMRLIRNTSDGKEQWRGMVHHPEFSDALTLQTTDGVVSFQPINQSNVVNE